MNRSLGLQFGEEEAHTVSSFTREIKRLLEGSIEAGWIKGEVSNFRRQASGHLYFSLKDESAQIPVVIFRGNAAGLDFELDNGVEILVYGEISVYEPHGRYQLIARAATQSGHGKLHREFERLKRKLLEEGLFEKDRKRELPMAPRSIAFITSPTGAAVQDFMRILKRRGWVGRLVVLPAKVQGADAADTILKGLAIAEKLNCFDVIVVGRGGGSLEDLWCFNEERLVRALAASAVPVISAVGHEIDFTLSDFAVDLRAETPSAAAELISSSYLDCVNRIGLAGESLDELWEKRLLDYRRELRDWKARMRAVAPERRLEFAKLKLDEMASRIETTMTREISKARRRYAHSRGSFGGLHPERTLSDRRQRLRLLGERSRHEMDRRLALLKQRFVELGTELRAIGPAATLKRGYSILAQEDGSVIASVEDLTEGERIRATLADGESWLTPEKESCGGDGI
ncbi:MAG: exodeoxyribonuclease VII large subunit [Opitutales bacterium]